jgi:hypothetical protein
MGDAGDKKLMGAQVIDAALFSWAPPHPDRTDDASHRGAIRPLPARGERQERLRRALMVI